MEGEGDIVAMPFEGLVALRYLMSKKKHRSLSFTTGVSIGGVAVGVMALLVVLAVMTGFHEDLQKKILGVSTHLVVMSQTGDIEDYERVAQEAERTEGVVSAAPFVLGQAMVSSSGGRAQGVYVRGIDPGREMRTSEIESHMREGTLRSLDRPEGEMPGIVLGMDLAARLGVFTGDEIKVVSPFGGLGPLGNIPRIKTFSVVGVFEVGMYEYDANLVLTSLGSAAEFFDMGEGVSGVELRVADIYGVRELGARIRERLGYPYATKDWIEMNRSLFAALKLEKLAMFVILTLIVLVAAFNIVSTQTMNVIEKEREIAILKAMGSTNRSIMAIFVMQGFLIGIVGTVIGIVGGVGLCYLINRFEIIRLPADVYYLSHLPARIQMLDFSLVTVSAVVISFLATIYPAWQAARLDPVDPLRYE
jgi:lipoprotein-releasing system permease protein